MAALNVYILGAIGLGTLSTLWGASPAIGVATGKGSFAVNKSQVSGSATLFDGSLIETGTASSRLQMSNGSRIDLNANSSLTVRGTEAVLEKGSGEFGAAVGFNLQARTLRIETDGATAKAEVRLDGDQKVLVKSLSGPVRVFSKTGVLVALVNPGMGVMLDPSAAPADSFDMSGCLVKQSSGPLFGFVADNTRYELTGVNLGANVGSRVHITGTLGAAKPGLKGANDLVQVTKVEVTGGGGCLAAAGSWPEPEKMSATPSTGSVITKAAPHSHTTAIIAGVAVAGAGGGIAAAVCCKSK